MDMDGACRNGHFRLALSGLVTMMLMATAVAAGPSRVINTQTSLPFVDQVSRQHLVETAERIVQAFDLLGAPMSDEDLARLEAATQQPNDEAIGTIQTVLDSYCLVGIEIDDEGWLKVQPASPDPEARLLVQHQWRIFLVKVHNESTATMPLEVVSPQALLPNEVPALEIPTLRRSKASGDPSRWIGLKLFQQPPMEETLSGRLLDYMILGIYSRDAGMRAAELVFRLGGGAVSQLHFADTSLLFHVNDADPVKRESN